jgi:hypothetical protein
MKRILAIVIPAAMLLALAPAFAAASPEGIPDDATRLYKLNIIGMSKDKTADMDGDNGKRIFVRLDGKSAIYLQEAVDEYGDPLPVDDPNAFAVLDANGTDKDGALFQMPKPGLDPYVVGDEGDADVWSDYSIYVRPLGKQGGWANITTCAELADSTFAGLLPGKLVSTLNKAGAFGGYASVEQVGQSITTRPKGKSVFTNVTAELLTVVFKVEVDLDGDGVADDTVYVRVPIFDDIIEGEYWEYDNHGLKLLQVWIYDTQTDVSAGDGEWNNES